MLKASQTLSEEDWLEIFVSILMNPQSMYNHVEED